MSFPRYPKYKASGVEWLGDVPEHWEVKRSDSCLSYSRAQLDPSEFKGLEVFHYSIPVVQETGTGQLENGSEIASGKQVIKRRVVLVSKLNPRKGTICIADSQQALTLCSTEFVALEPFNCEIQYLHYLVRTEGFRQKLESTVTSVTNSHQRASPADIYRFWGAFPPLAEQTAIAEFLDRETAKIDGLVAEQRRLIALLKEKRQAVISHAVTKGLHPNAPTKPSGIPWLGDVPAHWEVKRLKSVATFSGGGTPSRDNPAYWNGNIPWVSPKDMKADRIDGAEESISEEGLRNSASNLLKPGRVLIVVRSGILKHTIPIAINETAVALNQDMKALSFETKKCVPQFFLRWVQGNNEQLLFDWAKQGATVESIEHNYLAQTLLPLPDIHEQKDIVAYLDTELARFDELTAEAERAIDLLHERRTALISAAVTGQIDVRQHPAN